MKKFLKILPAVMLMFVVLTSVFALDLPSKDNPVGNPNEGSITVLDTSVNKVWNTVSDIMRILALAAVVFAGLRYMFASADQKADIKKSMGILAVGAILVFGASFVLDAVIKIADEVL